MHELRVTLDTLRELLDPELRGFCHTQEEATALIREVRSSVDHLLKLMEDL